jgi:hypothetical protein
MLAALRVWVEGSRKLLTSMFSAISSVIVGRGVEMIVYQDPGPVLAQM